MLCTEVVLIEHTLFGVIVIQSRPVPCTHTDIKSSEGTETVASIGDQEDGLGVRALVCCVPPNGSSPDKVKHLPLQEKEAQRPKKANRGHRSSHIWGEQASEDAWGSHSTE